MQFIYILVSGLVTPEIFTLKKQNEDTGMVTTVSNLTNHHLKSHCHFTIVQFMLVTVLPLLSQVYLFHSG